MQFICLMLLGVPLYFVYTRKTTYEIGRLVKCWFFPCFILRAHTISFSLSLCFCLWMLKKWNHSIQFNVRCVSTAIPKRFNLNVVVKNFRSIQKRVLATFFFLSRRKCVFSLVSLSSFPVCSFAICPIYYRIIIKNACNKIAVFDLFI